MALAGLTVGAVTMEVKRLGDIWRSVSCLCNVCEGCVGVHSDMSYLCRCCMRLPPPGGHCLGLGHGAADVDQRPAHVARDKPHFLQPSGPGFDSWHISFRVSYYKSETPNDAAATYLIFMNYILCTNLLAGFLARDCYE